MWCLQAERRQVWLHLVGVGATEGSFGRVTRSDPHFFFFFLGCVGSLLLHVGFSCGEWGLIFFAVRRLLIAVASLVAEHGLEGAQASEVVAHGL